MSIDPRNLDVQVGSILYRTEYLKVDWYPLEILGFYEQGNQYLVYSYDENACNAKLYCNSVDATDGFVPALPFYSTRLEAFQEVINWMLEHGGSMTIQILPDRCIVSVNTSFDSTGVIEYTSPAPKVIIGNSDIALAGCQAFINAYKELEHSGSV